MVPGQGWFSGIEKHGRTMRIIMASLEQGKRAERHVYPLLCQIPDRPSCVEIKRKYLLNNFVISAWYTGADCEHSNGDDQDAYPIHSVVSMYTGSYTDLEPPSADVMLVAGTGCCRRFAVQRAPVR